MGNFSTNQIESRRGNIIEEGFIRGLRNLGNTCFLNSVLQSLASCPRFEKSIRSNHDHFSELLRKCFQNIRRSDNDNDTRPFCPSELFKSVVIHDSSFDGLQQQDAHEVLQIIVTMLSENADNTSSNEAGLKTIYHLTNSNSEVPNDSCMKKYNSTYNQTQWTNPFSGRLASELICQTCKEPRPIMHQNICNISLQISRTQSNMGEAKSMTLIDCLRQYTESETIDEVDCPMCSYIATMDYLIKKQADDYELLHKCHVEDSTDTKLSETNFIIEKFGCLYSKGETDSVLIGFDILNEPESIFIDEAVPVHEDICQLLKVSIQTIKTTMKKQLSFSRLPDILCIHICRRVYNELGGGMKKLSQHISFEMTLNMSKFFSAKHSNNNAATPSSSDSRAHDYNLCSVIVHEGSADSGHYYSYCRVNSIQHSQKSRWVCFSDANFRDVEERQVRSAQAYMLFYEKENQNLF